MLARKKLKYYWLDLFRVINIMEKKEMYIFEEMYNVKLKEIFVESRLKVFVK